VNETIHKYLTAEPFYEAESNDASANFCHKMGVNPITEGIEPEFNRKPTDIGQNEGMNPQVQ